MDLTEAVARHDEQIKTLTEQQNTIKGLTESTHSLALSIQKLADRIANQEERMDTIEESTRYKNRTVWTGLVSGILGAIVSAVCAIIFR